MSATCRYHDDRNGKRYRREPLLGAAEQLRPATPKTYTLCDDCNDSWVRLGRASQGLPPKIEDPAAVAHIAQIIRSARH